MQVIHGWTALWRDYDSCSYVYIVRQLLVVILLTRQWYLIPSEAARPLGLGPAGKLSNQISSANRQEILTSWAILLFFALVSFPGCLGMSLLQGRS